MTKKTTLAAKIFGGVCLLLAVPAVSLAQPKPADGGGAPPAGQNGGPGGGGPGGGRGGMMGNDVQQVAQELNLTDEQKTQVRDIMQKVRTEMQDKRQEMQDMSAEERRDAMTKMQTETRGKILAVLTDEQKAKYATAALKVAQTRVANMTKAVDKLEGADADKKKELTGLLTDQTKALDELKPDAEAAKDEAGITAFSAKLQKVNMEAMPKLRDAAGDDFRTLMQAGMPAGAGGRRGGAARPGN